MFDWSEERVENGTENLVGRGCPELLQGNKLQSCDASISEFNWCVEVNKFLKYRLCASCKTGSCLYCAQ